MKRTIAVVLFFYSATLFAQNDSATIIQGLVDKYGGNQITNDHTQASGMIYYADHTSKSFTLTAKERILRMELRTDDKSLNIVRQNDRSQVTKDDKIDYPNRTPRSGSAINLMPIFALLEFSDDLRFTGLVIHESDGSLSIIFVEGTPPGVKPPPFPQPKLIVTFTLDSDGRISQAVYKEKGGSARIHTY
jgi:hypothetical protein